MHCSAHQQPIAVWLPSKNKQDYVWVSTLKSLGPHQQNQLLLNNRSKIAELKLHFRSSAGCVCIMLGILVNCCQICAHQLLLDGWLQILGDYLQANRTKPKQIENVKGICVVGGQICGSGINTVDLNKIETFFSQLISLLHNTNCDVTTCCIEAFGHILDGINECKDNTPTEYVFLCDARIYTKYCARIYICLYLK